MTLPYVILYCMYLAGANSVDPDEMPRALSRYFGKRPIGKIGKNYRQNTNIGNTISSEKCQDNEVLLIIAL